MARRRSGIIEDLFVVLRALFGVVHPAWSVLVAAIFLVLPAIWLQSKLKIPQAAELGLLLGAIPAVIALAAGFAGLKIHQGRAEFLEAHLDIKWLNGLSWRDFERVVAVIYREQGYAVEETGGGGADGGVDLRIERNGMKAIVQCKRWKTYTVGVGPVRELFGVMTAEKADTAIFITSGIYTDEAIRFARDNRVQLVDGAQLTGMLRRFQSAIKGSDGRRKGGYLTEVRSDRGPAPNIVPDRPKCPRCGVEMTLRRARRGPHAGKEFWGCSTYGTTKCEGKRQVT